MGSHIIRAFARATAALLLASGCFAQTTTLTLQQDLSSKMPSGSAFRAEDETGKVYTGHLITHPARFFLRRGSMVLVFDDPVVPVTHDHEGVFRAGNRVRLLKLGGSFAAGKLVDDSIDASLGATKARYIAFGVTTALMMVQKGGEAKLHAGDTIEVEPRAPHTRSTNQ